MKLKLFGLAFCLAFLSTASLCVATNQPLIFQPVSYSLSSFRSFSVLIGLLCFLLVFMNLSLLRFIYQLLKPGIREEAFYVIGTCLILQAATIIIGYAESALTSFESDAFYYYKGVGNSYIYLITGNLTALIIASIYGRNLEKIKHDSPTRLDLDPPSQ
jgi:hypothetical protein